MGGETTKVTLQVLTHRIIIRLYDVIDKRYAYQLQFYKSDL